MLVSEQMGLEDQQTSVGLPEEPMVQQEENPETKLV